MTHDGGEMDDYADDIDTLLVFVSALASYSIVCLSFSFEWIGWSILCHPHRIPRTNIPHAPG